MKTDWNGDEVGTAAFCENNPILKGMLTQLAALIRARKEANPVAWLIEWPQEDGVAVMVELCKEPALDCFPAKATAKPLFANPPTDSVEAKDAARYRWLRDESDQDSWHPYICRDFPSHNATEILMHGPDVDMAIDTAMSAE